MYVLNVCNAVNKEGQNYKYISINVVIDDEKQEIGRHFLKKPSDRSLVDLSKKREGDSFEFHAELKTEISKKNTEYRYLSISVPFNGVLCEVGRYFFESDSAYDLIAESESQYKNGTK